jgi:hypothetical protein
LQIGKLQAALVKEKSEADADRTTLQRKLVQLQAQLGDAIQSVQKAEQEMLQVRSNDPAGCTSVWGPSADWEWACTPQVDFWRRREEQAQETIRCVLWSGSDK